MKPRLAILMLCLCGVLVGADDRPAIRVGKLTYADGVKTECFADAFLAEVDRKSTLHVDRTLHEVDAGSEELFNHPMVVMAGEKSFALTASQEANLRAYLMRGGFLLASAKCEDKAWDASFRAMIEKLVPRGKLEPIAVDHPLLHTLFEIDQVRTVWPTEQPLWGLTINGRLAVLYSPVGLNDSSSLPTECCCCGANDVQNAKQINANAVVYAVTR